jgi:hypothetical protein
MTFSFSSTSKDTEDANIRLKNNHANCTIVSFRAGYNGFMRVNSNQIVAFYNDTLAIAKENPADSYKLFKTGDAA